MARMTIAGVSGEMSRETRSAATATMFSAYTASHSASATDG